MNRAVICWMLMIVTTSVSNAEDRGPVLRYQLSDSEEALVEQTVRDGFKDPESARFDEVAATQSQDGGVVVCGLVNARNSFGGYAGRSPFMGMLTKNKVGETVFLVLTSGSSKAAVEVTRRACMRNDILLP
ncbi:hypothetical protein HGO34_15165 [Agrobacterium vitis]|uniref:Uncharacterized protein n=1 Tax=Agrobacterium vitis TaxID=373 RepID=A0AAE4WEZ9_AGRVI|nr:hypothetical protein [Agrobacterium vitis]MCF1499035.1 hypothetical protein [Allorhizobium sp. Av2]MCM2441059.1 hypothetical protein [Agrobacterium vitis]MUZ58483.1 hypothetical protein [Agrobacterium vitis]MVA65823.1 hypothetical protein [Agrobacterium vitis]MVA88155.1 hypothetical protein [Agrobacterium vitis]